MNATAKTAFWEMGRDPSEWVVTCPSCDGVLAQSFYGLPMAFTISGKQICGSRRITCPNPNCSCLVSISNVPSVQPYIVPRDPFAN